MGLMKRFIRRDLAELHQKDVRIRVIGEREQVDPELLTLIDEAVELTSATRRSKLVIAFNYGSRGRNRPRGAGVLPSMWRRAGSQPRTSRRSGWQQRSTPAAFPIRTC